LSGVLAEGPSAPIVSAAILRDDSDEPTSIEPWYPPPTLTDPRKARELFITWPAQRQLIIIKTCEKFLERFPERFPERQSQDFEFCRAILDRP